MQLMSELTEPVWAVMSERGCEATSLTYDEARKLSERLGGEGIYGRCIITARAAHNLTPASQNQEKIDQAHIDASKST